MWWPAKINKERTVELNKDAGNKPKHYKLLGECSNNSTDFVFDVMAKSSLQSFSKSLKARTTLLAHHDTKSIIGFSTDGIFKEVEGKMLTEGNFSVQRDWKYMGIDTEEFIKGVEGNSLLDLSIGARVGKRLCGIESCGKEKLSFLAWLFGAADDDEDTYCTEHVAGEEYDGVTATNLLENCKLMEVSSVYAGSCPDAQFLDKVCNLADMNKDVRVSADDIRNNGIFLPEIGGILEANIVNKQRSISLPELTKEPKLTPSPDSKTGKKGDNNVALEEKVIELRTEAVKLIPGLPSDPSSALEQFIKSAEEWKSELAKLQNEAVDSKHKINAYNEVHEGIIKEALESGVKARGDKFKTETWRGMLENSNFNEIAAYKEQWDKEHEHNAGPDGKKILDDKNDKEKSGGKTPEPGQYSGTFSLPGSGAWLGAKRSE